MFDTCEVDVPQGMSPIDECNKVFVYGSLKKGYGNHGVLSHSHATLLQEDATSPIYDMIGMGGFPGVLPDGATSILGEVYEVDCLEALDGLEGHPTFYKREVVTLSSGIEAWIYILQRELGYRANIIATGFWENPYG